MVEPSEHVASHALLLPGKIVIIDDEKDVVETIGLILGKEGHTVTDFSDGDDALLPALRSEKPDLIILDIKLPSRDGIEVLRELQADPSLKNVPVIVCSVIRQKKRIVEALDAGAVDFLTKPFEPEELQARVHSALILRDIEIQSRENDRLETLRKLADTVHKEILTPLSDMRTHLKYLRTAEMAEQVLGARSIIDDSLRQIEQIERALGKYSPSLSSQSGEDV